MITIVSVLIRDFIIFADGKLMMHMQYFYNVGHKTDDKLKSTASNTNFIKPRTNTNAKLHNKHGYGTIKVESMP